MDIIGIGSTFVDYFFEADRSFLKKYKLKPEDDVYFGDRKGLTLENLLNELPLLYKSPGGMSTNTVAAMAALGAKSAYYGVIGNDEAGNLWREKSGKINLRHVLIHGKTSICACILSNNRKNRLFISKMNKLDNVFFKKIDYKFLNSAKIVHISPFVLDHNQSISKLETILGKINKPKISFTPSLLGALLGLEKMSGILKNIDILFLNKDELRILTKKGYMGGSNMLLKMGPEIVVCTLGAAGALITTRKEQFKINSYKVREIVDSTGSGDAFAAGFLYGVLKEKDIRWSARFGSKIAAKSLSNFGLSWIAKLKIRF